MATTTPTDGSKALLFASAAVGNLAPLALRWYAEEQITLPRQAIGGLLAFLLLAALAGFVAVFVWQEKTARRAFFIGLAFPYVLTGFLVDAQQVSRIRQVHAQYGGSVGGSGFAPAPAPTQGALAALHLTVMAADGRTPEAFSTRVLASDRELSIVTKSPGEILVPPGTYRVVVSAPGYKSTGVNVTIEGTETRQLSITLQRATFAEDVWSGFRAIVLPNRGWLVP